MKFKIRKISTMMFRNNIFLFAFWFVSIPFASAGYDEMYRPQLHYSPPKGWLSDANGLVYGDEIYHLFHQCQPYDTNTISNVNWGHAISTDLIHWKTLEPAIVPPFEKHAWFSGGAIFDRDNITGLQTNSNVPTLILLPSLVSWRTGSQDIWLAYSNDAPEYSKFKYYENKALLSGPKRPEMTAFRDLSVFKYQDYYIAIIAAYDRMKFYHSRNLLNWKQVSEFGQFEGVHTGRWECPSLLPFKVSNKGKQVEKYVLLSTITDMVHPLHQYFIGSFDGKAFKNENSKDVALWLDYGPDCFAGITYYQLPDGRHIWINWMGRWEYAENMGFNPWNGQMGLPRELKLIQADGQLRLTSLPISEVETLRTKRVRKQNINIVNEFNHEIGNPLTDIEMLFDLKKFNARDSFDIVFSGKNDSLKISFKENEFILDRSRAGKIIPNFVNPKVTKGNIDNTEEPVPKQEYSWTSLWKAPRFIKNTNLKMRLVLDTNGIEMFADDGLTSMSALFFSEDGVASKMSVKLNATGKTSLICLKELNIYEMKSIWSEDESIKKKIQSSTSSKRKSKRESNK